MDAVEQEITERAEAQVFLSKSAGAIGWVVTVRSGGQGPRTLGRGFGEA